MWDKARLAVYNMWLCNPSQPALPTQPPPWWKLFWMGSALLDYYIISDFLSGYSMYCIGKVVNRHRHYGTCTEVNNTCYRWCIWHLPWYCTSSQPGVPLTVSKYSQIIIALPGGLKINLVKTTSDILRRLHPVLSYTVPALAIYLPIWHPCRAE